MKRSALAFGLAVASSSCPASAFNAITISPSGAPSAIFDQAHDGCDGKDGPDAPAIAFRNADGNIVMFAPSFRNIPLVGPSLEALRKTCESSFTAAGNPNPNMLDDRTWIDAVFTQDGRSVFALGSAGYMPYRHNAKCAVGDGRTACWYNGIVGLKSSDGGQSFSYVAEPPNHILFGPPQPYSDHVRNPLGFVYTTNIVSLEGYGYVLARRRSEDGPSGTCVMRVKIGAWSQWQYWNGKDYADATNSIDTYNCVFVSQKGKPFPARGLYYHDRTKLWVATYDGRPEPSAPGRSIFYRTSKDLTSWSEPNELTRIETGPREATGRPFTVGYPTLIDENSSDPNFGHIGDNLSLLHLEISVEKFGGSKRTNRKIIMTPVVINKNLK